MTKRKREGVTNPEPPKSTSSGKSLIVDSDSEKTKVLVSTQTAKLLRQHKKRLGATTDDEVLLKLIKENDALRNELEEVLPIKTPKTDLESELTDKLHCYETVTYSTGMLPRSNTLESTKTEDSVNSTWCAALHEAATESNEPTPFIREQADGSTDVQGSQGSLSQDVMATPQKSIVDPRSDGPLADRERSDDSETEAGDIADEDSRDDAIDALYHLVDAARARETTPRQAERHRQAERQAERPTERQTEAVRPAETGTAVCRSEVARKYTKAVYRFAPIEDVSRLCIKCGSPYVLKCRAVRVIQFLFA